MLEVVAYLHSDEEPDERLYLAFKESLEAQKEDLTSDHYAELQLLFKEYRASLNLVVDHNGRLTDAVEDKSFISRRLGVLAQTIISHNLANDAIR